jgi:hypothetical protein
VRFRLAFQDVNGSPQAASSVEATYVTKGTDGQPSKVKRLLAPGELLDVQLVDTHVQFQGTVTNFAPEKVIVNHMGGRWMADNPACSIFLSGDLLDLRMTVGCVTLAPVVSVAPDTVVRDNPGAAFAEKVAGPSGEEFMYRGAWLNPENFTRLDDPVFGDADGKEWARFKHTDLKVEPKKSGSFLLLEYGFPSVSGSTGPRFLIATWVPSQPCGERPEVLVFYSPTTSPPTYPADAYPFRKNYPYAIVSKDPTLPGGAKDARQPYVDIGINYIITGYKIIYQLLAAGRNPIVVMPIQASGDWGPFATQGGIFRTIREVTRFLFARQLASARNSSPARISLANGRASVFPGHDLYTDESIPKSQRIVLSAFSAGINAVIGVCKTPAPEFQRYPPAIFQAPPAPLLEQWVEIWDIDGVDASGWNDMVDTFNRWVSNRGSRLLHSYHSQTTFRGAVNGLVPPNNIRRVTGKAGFVEEGSSNDKRVIWVYFSNSYLEGSVTDPGHQKTIPEFGTFDAHHMVPAIAFGHAAQLGAP